MEVWRNLLEAIVIQLFFIETLALKGLFTLFLGNRDEGFDICKSGLKLSLQSHVCKD